MNRVEPEDPVRQRHDGHLRRAVDAGEPKLRCAAEGRAVAAAEGVGEIPKSPAAEGAVAVGEIFFIGSRRRRSSDEEEREEEEGSGGERESDRVHWGRGGKGKEE